MTWGDRRFPQYVQLFLARAFDEAEGEGRPRLNRLVPRLPSLDRAFCDTEQGGKPLLGQLEPGRLTAFAHRDGLGRA